MKNNQEKYPKIKITLRNEERNIYDIFSFYNEINKELTNFEISMTGNTRWMNEEEYRKLLEKKEQIIKNAPNYEIEINNEKFHVLYRKDDWNYKAKEPNVVFLIKDGEIKYVLREARIYSPWDYEIKNFIKLVFNGKTGKFDIEGYKKLFNEKGIDIKNNKYFFIPEPMLIVAYKRISDNLNENIPIPDIYPLKEMKEGNKGTINFYYIRKYFNINGDIKEVLSMTFPLKLRVFADIENNFFDIYEENGKTFMIDPDFILYGGKGKRERQTIIELSKRLNKKIKNDFFDKLPNENINIFDYIPTKKDEILKEFENWAINQFHIQHE